MLRKQGLGRALVIALILCIALSASVAASAAQDCSQNQYQGQGQGQAHSQSQQGNNGNHFGNAAQYMISKGYMKGDGCQNYYLSGYIKRGDLMIMIVRAFNLHSNAGGNHFGDVKSGDYYCEAVNTAAGLGIAKGDGKNFMPQSYVTVQQAIWLIERTAKIRDIELTDDLESLYDENTLSTYATREDVCELLYYALTGSTDGFNGEFGNSHGWKHGNTSFDLTISYEIDEDEALTLVESDFTAALTNANDDETLSSIMFTSLPSSSAGVMYFDYDEDDDSNTKLVKSTSYDVGDIGDITFVPVAGYNGTVKVFFTAYTEDSGSYSGVLTIAVGDTEATADAITYTTEQDTALTFDQDNFSDTCGDATGETLSCVKFTSLSSSSAGILYFDYSKDNDSNTKIEKNTSYDAGDLGDIIFVPSPSFSGTVTVSYTGYTEDDTQYTGTVKITVNAVDNEADAIVYKTDLNEAVAFTLSDFRTACSEATGKTLSGVKFTLPDEDFGTLYYKYDEDDTTNTAVSAAKTYYAGSSPSLSNITFVPAKDYTGTVTIEYTGYTTNGTTYKGIVEIAVE